MSVKVSPKTIYSCLAESLDRNGANYIQLLKSDRKKISEKTVHQIRITVRRLEAALELLDSLGIRHKNLSENLQYIRKIHGPLRNMHVELESIKDMEDDVKAKSLKKFLIKTEKKLEKKLPKELSQISLNKQHKEILKLVDKLLEKDTPKLNHKAIQVMEAQNQKLLAEFKKTKQDFSPSIPKSIHPIRITAKRLRYQGEILKPAIYFDNINLAQLKHLQDTFGKIQNNNVLQKSIAKFLHKRCKKKCKSVIELQSHVTKQQHYLMGLVTRMKVMSDYKIKR